ncbi:hypothetical protein [Streptomyces xiaopingdaonensis]|uniref:hypothetical protein n=1 Tax=Streptomyces xiaopingdaonensis TaxID=1565415 RepID=UPI0012FE8181|nr:hypothetical protein [Streptomyces xiaopingdaonensis]
MKIRHTKFSATVAVIAIAVAITAAGGMARGFLGKKDEKRETPAQVCNKTAPGNPLSHLLPDSSRIAEGVGGFPGSPPSSCLLINEGKRVSVNIRAVGPYPSKSTVFHKEENPVEFGRDYGYYIPRDGALRLLIACDELPQTRSTLVLLVQADSMKGRSIKGSEKTPKAFLEFAGQAGRGTAKKLRCGDWEKIPNKPPVPLTGSNNFS